MKLDGAAVVMSRLGLRRVDMRGKIPLVLVRTIRV